MRIVPGTTQMLPGPDGTLVVNPAWLQARLAMPTASQFKRVIQPVKMGAASKEAQTAYMGELLAEYFLDRPIADEKEMQQLERGKQLEPAAVAAYEFETGLEAVDVGFCVRADGKVGASPDRLVGKDGALEVKVPLIHTHIAYIIDPHKLVADYWCQLQGELYVCRRDWVDAYSYHPLLPPVRMRVKRDEEFIVKLEGCLYAFVCALDTHKERLRPLREARLAALAEAMAAEGDGNDLLI